MERPPAAVQRAPTMSRTAGAVLGTVGGAILAYVTERVLPRVIDRLTREPDAGANEQAVTRSPSPTTPQESAMRPAAGAGRRQRRGRGRAGRGNRRS